MKLSRLKEILINVAAMLAYAAFYDYIYRDFICEVFAYTGTKTYIPMSFSHYVLYLVQAVLPIVFFKGVKNIASLMSFFTYFFVYIPFVNNLNVAGYPTNLSVPYSIVFLIFMCLFFVTDYIYMLKAPFKRGIKQRIGFPVFELLSLGMLLVVAAANIRNIHFVNIITQSEVMYEMREANRETGPGGLILYLSYWLKYAILPCLMVIYLKKKQHFRYAISFAAIILMFMIDMQKITFLMPFVITAVYFFYNKHKETFSKYFHLLITACFIVFPFIFNLMKGNRLMLEIGCVLINRTQCIEGIELGTYLRFFGDGTRNPFTHYTHISPIRKLFGGYPYQFSLGRAVTGGGANANGTFWLMDGVAADGVMGVVIISLIFIVFKAIFNSIGCRYDLNLCTIILLFALVALLNVSLFTALLSCGMLVFYFMFAFVKMPELEKNKKLY